MEKEKIFCSDCREEITPLSPCSWHKKILCGVCYIKNKFPNSQLQIIIKKMKVAEILIKHKKEELNKKEKLKEIRQEARLINSLKSKKFKKQKIRPRIKIHKKICKFHLCKKEFETTHSQTKYCTDKCRLLANDFDFCECGSLKVKKARFCRDCQLKSFPQPRNLKSGKFIKKL